MGSPPRAVLLLPLLAAGCSGSGDERIEKLDAVARMHAARMKTLEEEQQRLGEKTSADLDRIGQEIRALRAEVDRLRIEAAMTRRTVGPVGTPIPDVEAERRTQEQVEYLRRMPMQEEVTAEAIRTLRPLSESAVPLLVIELRQAMSRAELPLVQALEKVLVAMEPESTARALVSELDTTVTRHNAAWILGEIGQTLAREPLARHLGAQDFGFRHAVAQALVKLKGPEGKQSLPVLIEALRPERRDQNIQAFHTLRRLTGFTCGYRMAGTDEEKRASADAWQQWWEAHGDTFEFPE